MKKVLILDNSIGITGAIKSSLNQSSLLKDVDISYMIPRDSTNYSYIKESNFNVIPFDPQEISWHSSVFFYPFTLVANAKKLRSYIKKEKIDVLHVNDFYNMLGVMMKIFKVDVKVIYHVRLLKKSYNGVLFPLFTSLISKYADEILCVSKTVLSQIKASKARLLYDMPKLNSVPTRITPSKYVHLLYLANYCQGKGQNYALEVFKLAREKYPNSRMSFFGDTFGLKNNENFKSSLVQMVRELNLFDSVRINGPIIETDNLFKDFDILLNFSESESFSMTVAEGMANGMAVISSKNGGPEELINDLESGLLVTNRSKEEMYTALISLLKDQKLRSLVAEGGVKRINSLIRPSEQVKLLESVYN